MKGYRKEARRLLRKWQKAFRLMDWEIELRVVPYEELNHDKPMGWTRSGACSWSPYEREATIKIVDIGTVPDGAGSVYPLEPLIVHELLHLVVSGHLMTDSDANVERAIEVLTNCLVGGGAGSR